MYSPKTPPEGAVVLAGAPPTQAPPRGAPTPRRLLSTSLSALSLLALLPSSALAQVKEFSLFESNPNASSGQAAALGDLNGDGFLDIFWANTNGEPNQVSLNTAGSGTDGFALVNPAGLGNQDSQGVALGDIDNDGDLDAFVANVGQNHVWFNDGAGNFTQGAQNIGLKDSRAVALGDLNGDGRLDAFVVNSDSDAVYLYNTSTDLFATNNQVNLDTAQGTGVVLHDFDGDGDLDAVISNNNEPSALFENDGTGSFSQLLTFANSDIARGVELVDLNGDGLMDLYFARDNNLDDMIALNTTDMAATPVVVSFSMQPPSGVAAHNSSGIAFADTDNDGAVDLAVITVDDSVLANSGNLVYDVAVGATPTFTARANSLGAARSTDVVLGDLDNDGDIDAFVTNFGAPHTWWHMKFAPTAADDTDSVDEDGVLNRDAASGVLANDSDSEGFSIGNVTLVSDVSNGTLTLNANGSYDYEPNDDFFGTDSFTYKTSDGTQESNVATVTITVNGVNDQPVANDTSDSTAEDTDKDLTPDINDTIDNNTNLTVTITTQPTTPGGVEGDAGSATVDAATNVITYDPADDFFGTAVITYQVDDNSGATDATNTASITVTVNAVNDAPRSSGFTATVEEDQFVAVNLFAPQAGHPNGIVYDVDGDTLTISIQAGNEPSHGSASVSGGEITYTPNQHYNGPDSLTYTIQDNGGSEPVNQTLSFNVTPVNDGPPSAQGEQYVTDEDTALDAGGLGNPIVGVLDNDSSGVDSNETLQVVLVTPPAIGTLNLSPDGSFTYTPAPNNSGATFFRYKVSDGEQESSAVTASIVINALNDAPVAVNDSLTLNEDQVGGAQVDVLANDTDVEGDNLAILDIATYPEKGTVSEGNTPSSIQYSPNLNENGSDSFEYYMLDLDENDEAYAYDVFSNITITDDELYTSDAFSVPQESKLIIDLDCTGDTVLELFDASDDLSLEVNDDFNDDDYCSRIIRTVPAGDYYFRVGNYFDDESSEYTSPSTFNAIAFLGDIGTVSVTINAVNDDPEGTDQSETTNEDTPVTVNALAGATDVDGTPSLASCTDGTIGTTAPGPNPGEVVYSPTADLNSPADLGGSSDTFTCNIVDGDGGSDTITVSVFVNPVNDNPSASDDTATVDEDNNIDVLVLANDSDIDGDAISLVSCDNGNNGTTTEINGVVTYSPNLNFYGTDTFTCTISDGALQSTSTVTVTVNSVNDEPTLNSDPQTLTVAEEQVGNVTLITVVEDVEDDNSTLTISIAQAPANGTAEVVSGQMITYQGDLDFVGNDSFTYTVTDADGGTVTGTVNVTVTNLNDNPNAVDDTITTDEDTPGSVNVLTNDSDVDSTVNGDAPQLVGCGDGANGTTSEAAGVVTYTPTTLNFNGSDEFNCDIIDANGGTATSTVRVTINAVNDDPEAFADSDTVAEEGTVNIDITGNDDDVENDTLSVVSCGLINNGSIATIQPGDTSVSYTPNTNFNGVDSFSCTISDGQGGSASATVTVTVTPVNDAPTANDRTITVAEDSPSGDPTTNQFSLTAGDIDGDTVTLSSCTGANNGTVSIIDSAALIFQYVPNADYYGQSSDSFTCTVTDDDLGAPKTATATVTVNITPVNDIPEATEDDYIVNEDTTLVANLAGGDTGEDFGVLNNDSDVDNLNEPFYAGLTVRLETPPIAGELILNADGSFTYTPEPNSNDNVAFVYELIDNDEAQTPTGVFGFAFITINPVNDKPVAVNDGDAISPIELDEDTTDFPIDVLANDTDVANENQTLTVDSIETQPTNGTVSIAGDGSVVTYTPDPDYFGTDSFTYIVSDGEDVSESAATVFIQVNNLPDAPVANADGVDPDFITMSEEGSIVLSVTTNDVDVDNDALEIVEINGAAFTLNTPVAITDGQVTVENNSGFYSVVVEPSSNFFGTLSFNYTISDGDGTTANSSTSVTIEVTNTNDAPSTIDYSFNNGVEDEVYNGADGALLANVSEVDPAGETHTAHLVSGSAIGGVAVVNPDGSFSFTPNQDVNGDVDGDVSFSYVVRDQDGAESAAQTVTIYLAPRNDAPVAVDDSGFSFAEDSGAVVLNVVTNDTDIDNDTLYVQSVGAIVPSTAGTAAVIEESGTRVVEFTPATHFNGQVTIEYTVIDRADFADPEALSDVGTITIDFTPVNDAPVAVDDSFLDGVEDIDYTGNVLSNDTDPDLSREGDTLSATLVADSAQNGTVTLNSDGSFTFTPELNSNQDGSFQYTITDEDDLPGAAPATVTISFAPVDDNPVATADSYTGATEDTDFVVADVDGVLGNDSDVDGDALTAHVVDGSEVGGAVTLSEAGGFTFTPDPDFYGDASFQYVARDTTDNGADVALDSTPVTVTINFANTPDNPVAVDDPAVGFEESYVGAEDQTLTVSSENGLLVNDFDVDNQPLSAAGLEASVVAEPTKGTVNVENDGSFSYTPNADFNGTDSFTYRVSDGNLVSLDVGTVTIVIEPRNDAPVAVDQLYTTAEDSELTVAAVNGLLIGASDIDDDVANLRAALVTPMPATQGTLEYVNDNGSFLFKPALNFNGSTSFSYRVLDDDGEPSATQTVRINVVAVNDAPVANADSFSVEEDRTLNANPGVKINDVDVDGDSLTVTLESGVSDGVLSLETSGAFTYVPNDNFNGTDSFTYRLSDGELSSTAVVTITVTAVNDAPVATAESYSVDEDQRLTVNAAAGLLINDSDIDGDTLTARLAQGLTAAEGQLTLATDGSFIFDPAPNSNGVVSFTYQARDGLVSSNVVSVSITVNPVNDAPVARADAFVTPEDSVLTRLAIDGLLANDTDIDGDDFTVIGNTAPANGSLTVEADGSFTYTPNADYNGDDSFEYTIRDAGGLEATGSVSITIGGNNDAPVAVNDSATTAEDSPVSGNVLANDTDVDEEPLTAELLSSPPSAEGSVALAPDGSYTFTPALNFNGTTRFTYQALDPAGIRSGVAEVVITVTPVNDAPVANDDELSTNEDEAVEIPFAFVIENDQDVDSPLESIVPSVVQDVTNGTLEPNEQGELVYTPAPNFNGTDSFTYRLSDGELDSEEATITITVTPVNDAPTGEADSYEVAEEGSLTVALEEGVLINDDDIDEDSLSAILVEESRPSSEQGELTFSADGSFSFIAAVDFTGDVTFSYLVNDGELSSEPVDVTIVVTPVNDAPVALADSYESIEDTELVVDAAAGLLANDFDVDGDSLTVALISDVSAEAGELTYLEDGSFVFMPAADFFGEASFTYVAQDAEESSQEVIVTITVIEANDAPVAADERYEVAEDETLTVEAPGLLANATDIDSDASALSVELVEGPSEEQGSLSLIADGSFSFTPAQDFNGELSFSYSVSDGLDSSAPATVTITVTPVNDAPVIVSPETLEFEAAEGAEFSFTVSATDVDGDELSYSVEGAPESASFDSATGLFSWSPAWDEAGSYTVTVSVTDGELSDSRELTITSSYLDADEDGLADTWEESVGLDPASADSDEDGIDDATEVGDDLENPSNVDGDDSIDALDADSDDDGVSDADEAGDADLETAPVDSDEDGVADFRDSDSDDDAVEDGEDNCRVVANEDQADLDEDGEGDVCDADIDGDGLSNELETELGLDPLLTDSDADTISDSEEFGEGEEALDSDEDGVIDALDEDSDDDGLSDADEAGDAELSTLAVDSDEDGAADFRDSDSDDDGVEDGDDNCRLVANDDQLDTDGNGDGDACDGDLDGDGVDNEVDNCLSISNEDQADLDEDGEGDACDGDLDDDGVDNDSDNCPELANEEQDNLDGDDQGDACDADLDGDGVDNDSDNCPELSNEDQADLDGDGEGDACDADLDGDDVDNDSDNCPEAANPDQEDADDDDLGDVCDDMTDQDGDGLVDGLDNCAEVANEGQEDLDEDGLGDACDPDVDGDGIDDDEDNCPEVANEDQADADGDETGDACDEDAGDDKPSKKPDSGCDQSGATELPLISLMLMALIGIVSRRRQAA